MTEQDEEFVVVVNDEEQYSIWSTAMAVPAGWHDVGRRGTKQECLAYVNEVWTDMRPRSVR
jgi:MbtH protein